MYDNFLLKHFDQKGGQITGYSFDAPEPKAVICIVHGIGEHAGRYSRVADEFNSEGFAVCAMDLRGHGLSSGVRGDCAPRADILSDVDDLITWARAKYGTELPLFLYGHSMGGNIVYDYKCRGNLNMLVKGFIISAPWIKLVRPIPKSQYNFLKVISKVLPGIKVSSAVNEEDLGNPKSVGEYKTHPLVHDKITIRCVLEGIETGAKLQSGNMPNNGGATGKPILLMHGTEDKICDISGTDEAQKHEDANCKYIRWEGLKHEIHNGGKDSLGDEVITETVNWLKSQI